MDSDTLAGIFGFVVIACFLVGCFVLLRKLWRAGRRAWMKLLSRIQSVEQGQGIPAIDDELQVVRSDLEAAKQDNTDLNDKIRELTAELLDQQEKLAAAEKVEKSLARNLDLIKSAHENALGAAKMSASESTRQDLEKQLRMLAERLLSDTQKYVMGGLTPQNFATSKSRIESVFEACAKYGAPLADERKNQVLHDLQDAYKDVVRKDYARQEQARIKAQIREEQRLEAERQRELQRLENQHLAIETALQKALARAQDAHSEEVERLKQQLQEAQERLQRAKSQAELTKAGHVYVISNIGSFGPDVYKIGMTRRLEPNDRVRELGDASVPFPYDVHMMISCTDAPKLENALHKELHRLRLNKVNYRKEFFRVDFDAIVNIVTANHGTVDYVADPEALEYRNSQTMKDEDVEFVSQVLEPATSEEVE
jgi:hypothetical protein